MLHGIESLELFANEVRLIGQAAEGLITWGKKALKTFPIVEVKLDFTF